MALVRGIDVSRYQTVTSWPKVARAGVRFVLVKASERHNLVSPVWLGYTRGARAAGLLVGSYHFARPAASSAAVQAAFYVRRLREAGFRSGYDLPPALDIEDDDGMSKAALTDWCAAFLAEVDRRLELRQPWLRCGLYMNRDFYRHQLDGARLHNGRWLWLAAWPDRDGDWPISEADKPAGAAIWQWTDRARVAGVAENVDGDVAGLADLHQLAPAYFAGNPEGDDDMAVTDADARKIAAAVWSHRLDPGPFARRVGGYPDDATYPAGGLVVGADAYGREGHRMWPEVLSALASLAQPMTDEERSAAALAIAAKVQRYLEAAAELDPDQEA